MKTLREQSAEAYIQWNVIERIDGKAYKVEFDCGETTGNEKGNDESQVDTGTDLRVGMSR
jgi:hypothetical protein